MKGQPFFERGLGCWCCPALGDLVKQLSGRGDDAVSEDEMRLAGDRSGVPVRSVEAFSNERTWPGLKVRCGSTAEARPREKTALGKNPLENRRHLVLGEPVVSRGLQGERCRWLLRVFDLQNVGVFSA